MKVSGLDKAEVGMEHGEADQRGQCDGRLATNEVTKKCAPVRLCGQPLAERLASASYWSNGRKEMSLYLGNAVVSTAVPQPSRVSESEPEANRQGHSNIWP